MGVQVSLILRQTEINRVIGEELALELEPGACMVDVIKAVDEEISKRTAPFPVKAYRSLLQMTFHPIEKRFYEQVAIQVYPESS